MGLIKDGTISGVIPEKEAFVIHYPGYPSSTSRSIETLGGTEGILKAHNSKSIPLELRFRPEDPFSHPAFGKLHSCSNLLLKISRKKIIGDQGSVVSESISESSSTKIPKFDPIHASPGTVKSGAHNSLQEHDPGAGNGSNELHMEEAAVPSYLSADIVARVSEAFQFDGMADYQHVLAVHTNAAKKRKREWAEVASHYETADNVDIDQEELMILVPPLFSIKDKPDKLVLKPSIMTSAKTKQEAIVKQRWEMQIEPCLAIDFDIKKIPSKVNWEDHITRGSDHWKLQTAVSKLFDERPIWSKNSLSHRLLDEGLKIGDHLFRRLLFRGAYYFSTGPFRRLYIRKGYDPRKDPESRIYQIIDFRLPPPLQISEDVDKIEDVRHMWKDICAFQVFPCKSQVSLQLFDLVDDYIQQEISKPPEQTTCLCTTGWFSFLVLECLRLRVAVRFLSVYPNTGKHFEETQNLLKIVSRRFEKSKKALALKNMRTEDSEHQHVDKDSSSQPSKKSSPTSKDTGIVNNDGKDESDEDHEENDGDGEVEEEEEEEEEEVDDYESFQVDGDLTQPASSYTDEENISKNYLQELFGSFPGADKIQDDDSSDGEYQIFGDNYSDEDDDY